MKYHNQANIKLFQWPLNAIQQWECANIQTIALWVAHWKPFSLFRALIKLFIHKHLWNINYHCLLKGLVFEIQMVRKPVVGERYCSLGNMTLKTDVVPTQKVKSGKTQYGPLTTGLCPPVRADREQATDQRVKACCQNVSRGHLAPNTRKQEVFFFFIIQCKKNLNCPQSGQVCEHKQPVRSR